MVFKGIFTSILLMFSAFSFASQLDLAKQRCAPDKPTDLKLYNNDFSWGYSVEEMTEKYKEIYESGKRLQNRVYYDPAADQFFALKKGLEPTPNKVALNDEFFISVTQHIEEALERDYIQFVFFPDLGHAHLFVPNDFYFSEIRQLPTKNQHLAMEKMLSNEKTKLLYHTAEQLQMTDKESKALKLDPWLQWRYYTRNLVGSLNVPARLEIHKLLGENFNTVRQYPGYHYYGAGFDISASKDGCFPFKTKSGEIQYFDISLQSLERDPNVPVEYFDK